MARIAAQREDLLDRHSATVAKYRSAQAVAILGGIAGVLFGALLLFVVETSLYNAGGFLCLPIISVAVHLVSGFAIENHRATYRGYSAAIDHDEASHKRLEATGWWRDLCSARSKYVDRWRSHWCAFRAGEGGFDLYIRAFCQAEGHSWPDVRDFLSDDFRDFFQFVQLERCNGVPLRYWLEQQRAKDQALGRPTSIEAVAQARVDEVFTTPNSADPETVAFLAARAGDKVRGVA